jgi:hypothetical protein
MGVLQKIFKRLRVWWKQHIIDEAPNDINL